VKFATFAGDKCGEVYGARQPIMSLSRLTLCLAVSLAPLLAAPGAGFAQSSVVAGREYQGETLTVDLPANQHIKNIGSRIDGAGMCVFTSVEMAANWSGLAGWRGFCDWCAQHYPGGGYPQKLDSLIRAYAKARNLPVPRFLQYRARTNG